MKKQCITLPKAGAALTAGTMVKWDTSNADVRPATGVPGEVLLGIVEEDFDINDEVQIVVEGPARVTLGGAISLGDQLAINTSAQIVGADSAPSWAPIVGEYDNPPVDATTIAGAPLAYASGETPTVIIYRDKTTRRNTNDNTGVQWARFGYDFDTDGGAIGDINLGADLPDDAVILYAGYEVTTTFTSAGDTATVQLHAGGVDMVAATAINAGGNVWDDGLHDGAQDWAAANAGKTTAAGAVLLTVAVQALTAGALEGWCAYVRTPE
jgi:hypothetical protein